MHMPVAAALACLLSAPAMAQPTFPPCPGVAEIELAVANIPYAEIVHHFVGDDAVEWMAAYNAMPPVSAFFADEIIIVDRRPIGPAVFVWLLIDGCVTKAGAVPRGMHEQLLTLVLGAPS